MISSGMRGRGRLAFEQGDQELSSSRKFSYDRSMESFDNVLI